MCRLSWNLGSSTPWNPRGLSRPVMGLLYLLCILWRTPQHTEEVNIHVYWNILTMHGPINVKSPNNTSKCQIWFNSTFKGSRKRRRPNIWYTDTRMNVEYFILGNIVTSYNFFSRNSPQWARASSITKFLEHTHNDAPHSVGLLWTSDQPDAETSTWQHSTLTPHIHPYPLWDSKPKWHQARGRRLTP
jgi:hypothetical protein